MISGTDSSSLEGEHLKAKLDNLIQAGVDQFDPVRFRFIVAMLERANEKSPSIRKKIQAKADKALNLYQDEFDLARDQAAYISEQVESDFPDSTGLVQDLFEANDFKGVKRLASNLVQAKRIKPKNLGALAELSKQLNQFGISSNENPEEQSFDDILRQQEDEIVQQFESSNSESDPCVNAQQNVSQKVLRVTSGHRELKSIQRFRASREKIYADELVTQSIKEGPENPGPINPHMLAIRSISKMRDISPKYLSRFVSYIDSLFWLERAGDDMSPTKVKKSGKKSK